MGTASPTFPGDLRPEVRYTPPVSALIARLIAWFFVGVLYAVGPLLLLIAIGSSIPTAEFVRASAVTDGTVTYLQRVYSTRRSKDVYLPVFRFIASDGETHTIMAPSNASLVPFKRGDHVRILYLNGHPETARIDSIAQLWMGQIIVGIIGAALTTFPVLMLKRRTALYRAGPTLQSKSK